MSKTILLTGATDGIGLETAKELVASGHRVLLHGRSADKLATVAEMLGSGPENETVETYRADLSDMKDVVALATEVADKHDRLDVLINNAGVLKSPNPITKDGLDIRFVVNTFAPYLLTRRLLPLMGPDGRVINLSSAAQASINISAMAGEFKLTDTDAYSQSKLAITMWSRLMAKELEDGPVVVSVNPGSLLGSKMVKEGFGIMGHDLGIGVDILVRAALADEFAKATGLYYDNDAHEFAAPHPDGLDDEKSQQVVNAMEAILEKLTTG